MVVVINDDRVTDVEAYLPIAKAFAADSIENEEGCIMEVLTDPKVEGRVLYLSFREQRSVREGAPGEPSFTNGCRSLVSTSSPLKITCLN